MSNRKKAKPGPGPRWKPRNVPIMFWLQNMAETGTDMLDNGGLAAAANRELSPQTITTSQSPVMHAGYQMGWVDACRKVARALDAGEVEGTANAAGFCSPRCTDQICEAIQMCACVPCRVTLPGFDIRCVCGHIWTCHPTVRTEPDGTSEPCRHCACPDMKTPDQVAGAN